MKMQFKMSEIFFYSMVFISGGVAMSASSWVFIVAALIINSVVMIPVLTQNSPFKSSWGETPAKYFMVQAIGTSFYALGATVHGHWDMALLSVCGLSYTKWGLLMMFLGLAIKMGLFPFSGWVPGVTIGASWINCWILLTWQKFYVCVLFSQLMSDPTSEFLFNSVSLVFSFTALYGAYLGLTQTNLRSLMGCSSLSHTGWAIMASLLSYEILVFYFVVYSITLGFSFFVFNLTNSNNIQDPFLSVKSEMNPTLLVCTNIINLLSLGGMPPLLGFLGKWLILSQWIQLGYNVFPLCVVMVASFLSLMFYMNTIWGGVWRLCVQEKSSNYPQIMGVIILSHIGMSFVLAFSMVF